MVVPAESGVPTPDRGLTFMPLRILNRHVAPVPDPQVAPGEEFTVLFLVYEPDAWRETPRYTPRFTLEDAAGTTHPVDVVAIDYEGTSRIGRATQVLARLRMPTGVPAGRSTLRLNVETRRGRELRATTEVTTR